jgi:chromosomal replication initiator protein
VNSEEFTNDFINSIRDDEGSSFKQIYRNVDLLLIDDIQFLAGKEHTQEEFFHTFNALHNHKKQIVITSDLPPKQLSGFAERMRSRFEWGLITDVQPPELETRIAILRKKAQNENLDAPGDVMEYIASNITTNIRELEGALIRVTAFASLNKQRVDLPLAELVLKDLITDDGVPEITASAILGQTANYFEISLEELRSKSRNRTLVTARQIAMYLLRELTDMSLPKIGQEFGGTRPYDRDARRSQDPEAHGRAQADLQSGHRADQPHQATAARRLTSVHSSAGYRPKTCLLTPVDNSVDQCPFSVELKGTAGPALWNRRQSA